MARAQSNHRKGAVAAASPLALGPFLEEPRAIETQALQGVQLAPNLVRTPVAAPAPGAAPGYFFDTKIQNNVGSQTNPFHWIVNLAGFPLVNVVVQFRGAANKPYQVQLRHHHPSMYAMTCTYVLDSRRGTLPAAGFTLVEFVGIRPRLAELDLIAFSTNAVDFSAIAATVYATSS